MNYQLLSHVVTGGDVAEADQLTGRRRTKQTTDLGSFRHLRPITAKPQAWEEGNPCYLAGSQHPPKVK